MGTKRQDDFDKRLARLIRERRKRGLSHQQAAEALDLTVQLGFSWVGIYDHFLAERSRVGSV